MSQLGPIDITAISLEALFPEKIDIWNLPLPNSPEGKMVFDSYANITSRPHTPTPVLPVNYDPEANVFGALLEAKRSDLLDRAVNFVLRDTVAPQTAQRGEAEKRAVGVTNFAYMFAMSTVNGAILRHLTDLEREHGIEFSWRPLKSQEAADVYPVHFNQRTQPQYMPRIRQQNPELFSQLKNKAHRLANQLTSIRRRAAPGLKCSDPEMEVAQRYANRFTITSLFAGAYILLEGSNLMYSSPDTPPNEG